MANLSALLALVTACNGNTGDKPTDTPPPTAATVTFHTAAGEVTLTVEIAYNALTRAKGLMYRETLPANAGMVFVFPTEEEHSFWMKNTYIPLDMIFLSAAKKVVGVIANAEPLTETSRSVDAPSKYVVEVNGGFAAQHGIVANTVASFENVPENTPQ